MRPTDVKYNCQICGENLNQIHFTMRQDKNRKAYFLCYDCDNALKKEIKKETRTENLQKRPDVKKWNEPSWENQAMTKHQISSAFVSRHALDYLVRHGLFARRILPKENPHGYSCADFVIEIWISLEGDKSPLWSYSGGDMEKFAKNLQMAEGSNIVLVDNENGEIWR